jgi:glyceraldehyde-3-phosphate dehydrogenase/erythrose-4-phosphate dehydrogenase
VSAIDLVATLARPTRIAEVHACLQRAASVDFSGQLACSDEPHASIDFNHSRQSAIVDTTQTHLAGERLLNLLIWFDNEWGFANRMLDLAGYWGDRLAAPAGPD